MAALVKVFLLVALMVMAAEALPMSVCMYPPKSGFCRAFFIRYHFNPRLGQCQEFIYGGCGANPNNFYTQEECNDACLGMKMV